MKRVVITGLGVVSCIGNNKEEVLASLKQGKSGIEVVPEFVEYGMRSHIAGTIKNLELEKLIDRKIYRFMSPASAYAYLAMKEAIEDSKLTEEQISNPRTGIIMGVGGASPECQTKAYDNAKSARGVKSVGPYSVPKTMCSGPSANLAVAYKIKGINYTISSACSTSAHCIGNAVEQIQLGKQDIIFAGGGEELSWQLACLFDAMGALSFKYNDQPTKASRPYDADRDGFVISSGGAVLVVESLDSALARGAHIYAEVVGYGANSDGYDMVAPSGEGAYRCMQIATQDFPDLVPDYINTHGTSTPVGDIREIETIAKLYPNKSPAISSTKSMTGHSLGATSAHEAIYSLLMMEHGFIAPSINVDTLDPAIPSHVDIVTEYREQDIDYMISNSFGFGGTNASLAFKKYRG